MFCNRRPVIYDWFVVRLFPKYTNSDVGCGFKFRCEKMFGIRFQAGAKQQLAGSKGAEPLSMKSWFAH
jgi:hypothetical protein